MGVYYGSRHLAVMKGATNKWGVLQVDICPDPMQADITKTYLPVPDGYRDCQVFETHAEAAKCVRRCLLSETDTSLMELAIAIEMTVQERERARVLKEREPYGAKASLIEMKNKVKEWRALRRRPVPSL